MEEESWRRNRGGGIMEDESWRMHHGGGIMEQAARRRQPGGDTRRHPGAPGATKETQELQAAKWFACPTVHLSIARLQVTQAYHPNTEL